MMDVPSPPPDPHHIHNATLASSSASIQPSLNNETGSIIYTPASTSSDQGSASTELDNSSQLSQSLFTAATVNHQPLQVNQGTSGSDEHSLPQGLSQIQSNIGVNTTFASSIADFDVTGSSHETNEYSEHAAESVSLVVAGSFMVSASAPAPRPSPGAETADDIGSEYKLVHAHHSKESSRTTLPPGTNPGVRSTTGSLLLDMLPREIRNEIYKYLLVNPMLAQSEIAYHPSYCPSGGDEHQPAKYDLSTSLLYTCRQLYDEGSETLYGVNTFCIYCFTTQEHVDYEGPYHAVSPLLRKHIKRWGNIPTLGIEPVRKIRRWKVLVTAYSGMWIERKGPSRILFELCKIMNKSRPQSLEILIIPQGIETHYGSHGSYIDIDEVLSPFRLLRNMPKGSIHVRDANLLELHNDFIDTSFHGSTFTSQLPDSISCNELVVLAESDETIEFVYEMYPGLLRYAQSFERYEPFRVEMGFIAGDCGEYVTFDNIGSQNSRYIRWYQSNPFKIPKLHPIEKGLNDAKIAGHTEDVSAFKASRCSVLEYLEPQYQRIMAASTGIVEFIKREKRYGGLFDASYRQGDFESTLIDQDLATEAIILLERYAASFFRDAPLQVQIEIKKQQRVFDEHYWDTDREGSLAEMSRALEMGDAIDFRRFF